ncbi:MAG: acyl-CoA dehydrogenase [Burkholderiales bacterium PBB5]|nr:MAG: acyl-CoA dehydrogenase [Burkholderiales bacterium PBB5]
MLNALVDTVARYVRERLVPLEHEVADTDEIPPAVVQEMRDMGLFGLTIPEQHGGLGLTMEEEVQVLLALGQTSPAFRSVIGTTVGIGSQGILMDGTPAQQAQWLPRLASGELMASFALTEPGAGSDAASLRTSARREGDVYIVNGSKRYITNAPHAGIFTLMARTDPANAGAGGVSAFIVDAKSPGISFGARDRKMGQKGAHTCDVIFDHVRVPAANLIGGREGQGFKTAMKVLDKGRIHIAAVCVAVAQRLIRDSVAYASEREQFGHDGRPVATEAACCKLFASEMVGRVADRAVQIFGGAGYMAEYGIERFYRDVRLFRLYEGTSQIQQLVIGRNLLRAHRGG